MTTVLDLVARAVDARADAIAIEEPDRRLTYAQLAGQTNALARQLHGVGVGTDQLVAICARPSIEMIVAMLAVWTAGGAFVLVDLGAPAARIGAILAESNVAVALVDAAGGGAGVLSGIAQLRIRGELAARDRPPVRLHAGQLAYAVFTSGSTGKPKGVAVTHAGLANLIERQIETFAIDATSRVLQFAPIGFDAVISEVGTALAAGATLCIEDRRADQDIAELLERRAISVVTLPPSLLRVLAPERLAALRTVVSAGEACSAELVARWATGRRMINAYGPSECTVCATMKTMAGPHDVAAIGRAIAGVRAYVLDGELAPVAPGGVGELYLAGPALARGYLGRRSLTAERFVPDPFAADGSRMYRTGDLVRAGAGGELDYRGRSDDQVKIRGFRVEPAELEAVLRDVPDVDDAVVLARERAAGDVALVAFVVSRGLRVTERELFAAARARLPHYLRPSQVVVLEAWPRSPNGKIDRAALASSRSTAIAGAAARTASERRLVELACEVLDRDAIDLDRGFVEQGGDSIAAIRLVLAIGRGATIGMLFEAATLRDLAAALDRLVAAPAGARRAPYVVLRGGDQRAPIWLPAPVHGNALCYLRFASLLAPGPACLGLQAPGLDGEREPIADFVALAAHHVATIRAHQPRGPYVVGGWSMGGSLAFEIAVQLQQAGERAALFLLAATAPTADHLEFARRTMQAYEPWRIGYFYVRSLAFSLGTTVPLEMTGLASLSDGELHARLVAQMRALGELGESITPELAARWLGVVRASLFGFQHQTPSGRFAGRSLVVRATGANPLDRDALTRARAVPPGRWEELLIGEVARHEIGANHYTLLRDPWIAELAELVNRWLAVASSEA